MTLRDRFSDSDWEAVGRAPYMVSVLIVTSDLSDPIGIATELLTAESVVATEAAAPGSSPFAREIFADIEAQRLNTDVGVLGDDAGVRSAALEALGIALAAVETFAPAEAAEYRALLYRVAVAVAKATREGGNLFARKRISDGEKAALAELRGLLSIPG
jgi:hypothetical protein